MWIVLKKIDAARHRAPSVSVAFEYPDQPP